MSNNNVDNSIQYADNGHLFNNIQRLPLQVDNASGSTLYVGDGASLYDFWGDEGVCALGYNTAEYQSAVQSFAETGYPHQLPDVYPHPLREQCASMLCERSGMDRVFFSNSGAEANEGAIKLARKHWWDKEVRGTQPSHYNGHRRHVVLTVAGNFHGRTGLCMAASDPRVSPYHRWGYGPSAKGFGVVDLTEGGAWVLKVEDGRELFQDKTPDWDSVAAIILAPVLGNNLVKTYPAKFWNALQQLRERTGCLLIYDDVQAGMGRAGSLATWTQYGVKPDIMTLGKGIAMGYPMSAILAQEDVAQAFTPGVHFNTFGGSPFVCHMAIEMMKWLDANQDSVNETGEKIRDRFANTRWIDSFDGSGMLNAFLPSFQFYQYDGYQFCNKARSLGLSLMTHRQYGPIRFTPPLNVLPSVLEEAFKILDETHDALVK